MVVVLAKQGATFSCLFELLFPSAHTHLYMIISRVSQFLAVVCLLPVSYTHLDVYKRQMRCCTREVLPSDCPRTPKQSLNSCKNCPSSFTSPLERSLEDLFNNSWSSSGNLELSEALDLRCEMCIRDSLLF